MQNTTVTNKQRLVSLDLLRTVAFALIILYHFQVGLLYSGLACRAWYETPNLHIATLGVSLFFIMSGFGLMTSSGDNFRAGRFYKKRFLRILLPFYIVYGGYFMLKLVLHKLSFPGVPKWRFVFTLLGMDEYLKMLGLPTFSLGIGEWFLGCLVLMYLLFPLVQTALKRAPLLTMGIATGLFLILSVWDPFSINPWQNFLFKFYEFILGACLALTWQKRPKGIWIPSLAVILLFLFAPSELPIPISIRITLLSLCVIFCVMEAEALLKPLEPPLRRAGGYLYEIYLVHHVVIFAGEKLLTKLLGGAPALWWQILLLLAGELVIMWIGATVVLFIEKLILRLANHCYAG
ncbi:MAG: acyltransferase [Lachnospiraceae bacterium]|nr:acyltransferase [Lachnospiraceae bacterium]